MSPHRYAIGAILLLIPIIAFPAILHVPDGAILITQASPTIRNCMLAGNSAEGYHDNSYSGGGGAIMVYGVAAPHIQGNIIRDNVAHNLGGGLLFAEGASGEVRNNVIIHNSCSGFNGGRGGVIYLGHSQSRLINNTIAYNATTGDEYGPGYGGGISISN